MADSVTIVFGADGLLPTTCPAADPLASVRVASHRRGTEVPGVMCRVIHEPVDLDSDPQSAGQFCCHPDGGHRRCPIWEEEKAVIAAGFRSLGDQEVAEEHWHRTWRDDLTGSRYGDVSFLDALEAPTREAAQRMLDPDGDGFISAEGGA